MSNLSTAFSIIRLASEMALAKECKVFIVRSAGHRLSARYDLQTGDDVLEIVSPVHDWFRVSA